MYLTPVAVGYLTQLVLATLISGYFLFLLWQSNHDSTADEAWYASHVTWLAGFFVALTGFIATLFLEAVLLPTPRLYAVFLQNTLLGAALTCLLQFAHHFPPRTTHHALRNTYHGSHSRLPWSLVLSGLYTLWEAGYAVFRLVRLRDGVILYRPAWSDYVLLGFLLWVPLSFYHHLCAESSDNREGFSSSRWTCWLKPFLHPSSREARAARGFMAVFLFVAGLSVFNILRSTYLLSVAMANLGISVGILLAMFNFTVVYLNYRPETTSFMLKLVGMTLTFVLVIMGSLGYIISPYYERQYHPDLPDKRTLRFTPNAARGYDIAEVPLAFAPVGASGGGGKLALAEDAAHTCSASLDFAFPFYGQRYDQVYVCNDGAVSFGQRAMSQPRLAYRMYQYRYGAGAPLLLPLLTDLYPEISHDGGVFVEETSDRLVITWDKLRGFEQQAITFTFQVTLYPDGVFDFSYNDLPIERLVYYPNDDPGASLWAVGVLPGGLDRRRPGPQPLVTLTDLPTSSGPYGVIKDYHLEFRQHLHRLLLPLAGLIVIVSVLIVVAFPPLFQITLVSPLNALLQGVQRLEAGDYASRVPVKYADEIGYLTRAFNALAVQLGDLIHNLEVRVEARTVELDAANAQLRDEIAEREQAQVTVIKQQRTLAAFEERERLAHNLHDGLGQIMGYINVQAQAVQTLLDQDEIPAVRHNLIDLTQAAQQANHDIRAHILGLREPRRAADAGGAAPQRDFLSAVRDRLQELRDLDSIDLSDFENLTGLGLKTTLSVPQDFPTDVFAPAVEEQALRILQEALINIRKHANAHRVDVMFHLIGDADAAYVQMLIADDGVGYTPGVAHEANETHFGLKTMRERAEQVGGTLDIHSSPGDGTRLIVTLPRFADLTGLQDLSGLRLLLADDHPLFLDGLRNLLIARGFTVIGTARNGREARKKTRALRPDVVVMDLNMPKCNGIEATRAIKAEFPDVKIVILTVSEDEDALFDAIKSGASGYLLKSLDANRFCRMLVGLLYDDAPLAPGMAARILEEFATMATRPALPSAEEAEDLSSQQWEILGMVAEGKIYREIALELHLSVKTIKYHMRRILDILRLGSRAQAIAYYQQQQEEDT